MEQGLVGEAAGERLLVGVGGDPRGHLGELAHGGLEVALEGT